MNKIKWLYHRLRAMSVAEVLHRAKEKTKKKQYKSLYKDKKSIIHINKINIMDFKKLDDILEKTFQIKDLEKVNLNSEIRIYNDSIDLNKKINWHRTSTGKDWPKDINSFDISFKERDDLGELRYTWEMNRHIFLPKIALQYIQNNDEKMYALLKNHFYDWIEENPFLYGVNWMSPMEISIRAYEWLITYSIIKDKGEEGFKKDIITAIINSTEYVENNFSKYSSANNHLIVEAAIVSIIGYCIKDIYKQGWFEEGYNILKKELLLQIHKDGVNKEQATHYHAFVLDMMLQYNIFLNKIKHDRLHEELIFKMAEFIGYIYNDGNVVEFGDSDDAKILDLNGTKKNYYTFVLQLASIYYKKQLIKADDFYLEVKFLMGDLFSQNKDKISKYKYSNLKVYSEGGYCLFNYRNDFLLFDVGELGFGSIAAHGHADALAINYYNKKPIFIDPGTYIYNVEKKWRNYFRETENHNTLYADNRSQSKIEGPFLWSKKAKAYLIDSGENDQIVYFKAKHDGYFPKIHERAISYIKEEEMTIIQDSFEGSATLNYVIDKNIDLKIINDNLITLDGVYFYSSNKIEVIDKYISKAFLSKEETKGLKIVCDFSGNNKSYCIISSKSVEFKENKIISNGKIYTYINYNDIRGEAYENG